MWLDARMRTRPDAAAPSRRRSGVIIPFVLVSLVVLTVAFAMAVDTAHLWQARTDLNCSLDAAALAAAQALVDDALLGPDPSAALASLITRAQQQAITYASINPIGGQPLTLQPNPNNLADGDIVFGFVDPDDPLTGFQLAGDLSNPCLTVAELTAASKGVNAVRVTGERSRKKGNALRSLLTGKISVAGSDVIVHATAFIDRDVIGFRPLGGVAIPLAPLALLHGNQTTSWDYQVINGADDFTYDRVNRTFDAGIPDGIREIAVMIPLVDSPNALQVEQAPAACLLHIGDQPGDWDTLSGQIGSGLSVMDLAGADFGGRLVLDHSADPSVGDYRSLNGTVLAPASHDPALSKLLAALQTLQTSAEARIWPLFSQFSVSDATTGEGVAIIQAFVAARVVRYGVVLVQGSGPQLQLILQPAMKATGTAVTDAGRRENNPELYNRYVCKVRLEE